MVAMATNGVPSPRLPHLVKVHEVLVTYHMGYAIEFQVLVALSQLKLLYRILFRDESLGTDSGILGHMDHMGHTLPVDHGNQK